MSRRAGSPLYVRANSTHSAIATRAGVAPSVAPRLWRNEAARGPFGPVGRPDTGARFARCRRRFGPDTGRRRPRSRVPGRRRRGRLSDSARCRSSTADAVRWPKSGLEDGREGESAAGAPGPDPVAPVRGRARSPVARSSDRSGSRPDAVDDTVTSPTSRSSRRSIDAATAARTFRGQRDERLTRPRDEPDSRLHRAVSNPHAHRPAARRPQQAARRVRPASRPGPRGPRAG